MAKRNTLKQEYYKTNFNSYWKDNEGKPTIEYVNWLEDKIKEELINTDLETKLNYFLNDAFKVQRLRNHPNSNNIAEFVINWMKTNK